MPEKHVPDVLSTKYHSRGFPHSNHDMEVLIGSPWSDRAIFSSKNIAQVREFEVKYTKFVYTYLLCWIILVCKQTLMQENPTQNFLNILKFATSTTGFHR